MIYIEVVRVWIEGGMDEILLRVDDNASFETIPTAALE